MCALHFFASGSYQTEIADSRFHMLSQSSVSRCIHEVIEAANQPEVVNEWIRFPQNFEDLTVMRNEYVARYSFS